MSDTITINKKDLVELKRLYEAAAPGSTFMFKGKEVLKEYAQYLIEYAETQFGK